MFFKVKSEPSVEVTNHCFFIPVVEQFKAEDYSKVRTWNLAKSGNSLRKFYKSRELLKELEQLPEGVVLSCYKVTLSPEQSASLNPVSNEAGVFSGFLAVPAQKVESMSIFKDVMQVKYNPFYQAPSVSKVIVPLV